jgi:hypothetical protein
LLGNTVCERFWHHSALHTPLQAIIANLRGGMQPGLDIRLVYQAALGGVMSPHPS